MLSIRDNLSESAGALRAHKLRAALTMLGLTMGVATLIAVMTLVEGANVYVEQKIANLGTNVFQISRVPLVVTDFNVIIKALRNKYLTLEDMHAVAERCSACQRVGAQASSTFRVRYQDRTLEDTNVIGFTAEMVDIDTRTIEQGRYFTELEDQRGTSVCLIGRQDPGRVLRRRRPVGPHHPHRPARVPGDRNLRADRQHAGTGPGQLRRDSDGRLPASARQPLQRHHPGEGRRRRRRSWSARRTRPAACFARAAT